MLYLEFTSSHVTATLAAEEPMASDLSEQMVLELLTVVLAIHIKDDPFAVFDAKHRARLTRLLDQRERQQSLDPQTIQEAREQLLTDSTRRSFFSVLRNNIYGDNGWQKCAFPSCTIQKCTNACKR